MLTIRSIRRPLTLLTLVTQVAFLTSMPAFAGEQDFTLHNKTGVEIHALHISPHKSDEWGDDILGQGTLENGKSLDIKFKRSEKSAHWDLKIEDEAGNSVQWEDLNLLEISEVTLHLKDGKAWVDVK